MPERAAVHKSFRLEVHESLGSTNDEAMRRAISGDPGHLWILAREQTAGRGRHGRVWQSPRGNLYASLLLIDAASPSRGAELAFVAGVALVSTISEFLRHDRRVALKWPNDLLFARAKLAGVLLEAARTPTGRFACVLGFGVNCSHHPVGLPYPAINLSAIAHPIDPIEVLARLSDQLAEWIEIWDAGRGFARVRDRWMNFAAGLGESILVHGAKSDRSGLFRGLDDEGRLLLETSDGLETVETGDVFLSADANPFIAGDARV